MREASSTQSCRSQRTTPAHLQPVDSPLTCGIPMVRFLLSHREASSQPHSSSHSYTFKYPLFFSQALADPLQASLSFVNPEDVFGIAVYKDGRVCISILHSAGDDPHGYETAAERWSPVQSVSNTTQWLDTNWDIDTQSALICFQIWHWWGACRPKGRKLLILVQLVTKSFCCLQVETIMLSIISMLSSPNDESPANIDAAKEWREDREGFRKRVARVVRKSQESL